MPTRTLAVLFLGFCTLARAGETITLGGRVAAFCEQHKGKTVGSGQCTDLATEALAAAGAMGRGPDDPGAGDYTWGVLVLFVKGGEGGIFALGRPADLLPGDIIQFRDARFDGHGVINIDAHHTAVVAGMENDGLTMHVYEQNVAGVRGPVEDIYHLDDLKGGWVRVYRPVPAKGGVRAYVQNELVQSKFEHATRQQRQLNDRAAQQRKKFEDLLKDASAEQRKKIEEQQRQLNELFAQQKREMEEQQARFQQELEKVLRKAFDEGEGELRADLKSSAPERRFAATLAIGERRLFWQDDLIPLLHDDVDLVRQGARRSLVILSYLKLNPEIAAASPDKPLPVAAKLQAPRDFGPVLNASRASRGKAAEAWADWWKEQKTLAGERPAPALRKSTPTDALIERLVTATEKEQKDFLRQYTEGVGADFTEALARSIPRLNGDARVEAREGLIERLANRKEATLIHYLKDDDAEIRRAAALALAKRGAKTAVKDLAHLLLDPEPAVWRAAHGTLCELTGKDYGPRADASEEEKLEAAKRYTAWRP
jgi:hypothetical protein